MNFKFIAVFLFFLSVVSCAPKQAVKQEEQPMIPPPAAVVPPPDTGQKKEIIEAKNPVPQAEKKAEEQYVMLNFENADIETVISTVSEMLKINYILAPGVTGKITIQSYNKVPLSELFSTFQTVLEFNGFTAVKDGSFYRIVPIDTAKQQPVQIDTGKNPELPKDASFITQQIPLEYVKANDVANIVKNLMPRGTDMVVYEPSNMLIVTAPPSGIVKFMKLLETIDIPSSERDSIRTFVYNVENGEAKKLAEILKNIFTKQGAGAAPVKSVSPSTPGQPAVPLRPGAPKAPVPAPSSGATIQDGLAGAVEGEVQIEAYEDINAIIIKASPRAYLTMLETIKRLDVQPKQVLIEVLIAEVTLDDTTKFGLEWLIGGMIPNSKASILAGNLSGSRLNSSDTSTSTPSTPATPGTPSTPSTPSTPGTGAISFTPVLGSGGLFANIIESGKFNLFISALATDGKINVLASPHILALDNKEAKIEIGNEVPVATSITNAGVNTDLTGINNTTSQIQFKSVGTILTVTPHINEKKQVNLKINQEVSDIGQTVQIGGQGYTGFTTRKANTTAIVQDGHTLVIGGIIDESSSKSRSGIPFLSSIPVFGYLFGSTSDTIHKRELVIMITPHVVGSHEEADLLTEEYLNKVKDIKNKIDAKQKNTQADLHTHNADYETKQQ
jgi:type II secretion system protein D